MSSMGRREFLGRCAAGMGLLGQEPPPPPIPFDLPLVGRVRARPAAEIPASPLSVGFETLDRQLFEPGKAYPRLAALGAKWARCQTGWGRTERRKGEYDFAWLDDVVDTLRKAGIQPWFNLGYGNRLYTPEAPDDFAVGWVPLNDEGARAGWVRFVGRIAEHFRGRVRHWEIWNEPNITNFWKPRKPAAEDYVELVRITAPEIRRRIPDAVLVGGAFAGMPTDYFRRCLEAGMAEFVDRVSYHPYRPVPEKGYEAEVRAWRALAEKHKPGLRFWQGENGCPSRKGGSGALANLEWDELRQAKWVLRRILMDLALEIELTSYYHTVDLVGYRLAAGGPGKTNFKGLLRGEDYSPKPSYFAYQCLAALFDAETRRVEPEVRLAAGAEVQTASFVRRDRPIHAWWVPADLLRGFEAAKAEVAVPEEGFAEPVLVDPLSAGVHALPRARRSGGRWIFPDLPLTDWPLLVLDRSLV